jgi:hypothetical protein
MNTIKRTTKATIDSTNEDAVEVNRQKIKYKLMSCHQNSMKNHYIEIANRSFENVTKYKYLGTTVTNRNLINEEIKSRLGNACYHSVQNLSSCLLSENIKIKICKTIILPVVLYGYETWSVTLMEEHRLRVFENRVLRRISGPKRNEIIGGWRELLSEELHNLFFHQI